MFVSMIIPAYNEGKRIGRTLEAYGNFFEEKKKSGLDFEIIVVANACKDNTSGVVRQIGKKYKEIKLLDFKQGGKGFAVKQGFQEALNGKADLIGFVDADLATPPEAYFDLIKNINSYGGIIASRYVKGSVMKPRQKNFRILVSRIGNFIIRSLFMIPYRDTQCGAKLFKREAVEKVIPKLNMTQWGIDIDLLYNIRKLGYKIKEHPSIWQDVGGSKLNVKKTSVQILLAALQLRILTSKARIFFKFFKPVAAYLYKHIK